jgi:hypothetical protein
LRRWVLVGVAVSSGAGEFVGGGAEAVGGELEVGAASAGAASGWCTGEPFGFVFGVAGEPAGFLELFEQGVDGAVGYSEALAQFVPGFVRVM